MSSRELKELKRDEKCAGLTTVRKGECSEGQPKRIGTARTQGLRKKKELCTPPPKTPHKYKPEKKGIFIMF